MTRIIPAGSMILTPEDARILYQNARLGELRTRTRVGNPAIHQLITDITICAFSSDAAPGTERRHEAASEEREWWTVQELARAAGLSSRKIRLDAQEGHLPATKRSGSWLIRAEDARTYIESRKP